jgi:hypothetical protein
MRGVPETEPETEPEVGKVYQTPHQAVSPLPVRHREGRRMQPHDMRLLWRG